MGGTESRSLEGLGSTVVESYVLTVIWREVVGCLDNEHSECSPSTNYQAYCRALRVARLFAIQRPAQVGSGYSDLPLILPPRHGKARPAGSPTDSHDGVATQKKRREDLSKKEMKRNVVEEAKRAMVVRV